MRSIRTIFSRAVCPKTIERRSTSSGAPPGATRSDTRVEGSPCGQYRFGGCGSGRLRVGSRVVDGVERGLQQRAHAAGIGQQALALRGGRPSDRAGLRMGLLDDQAGLALGLVLQLVRGLLGRDERRPQQRLEVAVARELPVEQLDPVGEVGALPPDLLERVGDLLDQAVDGTAAVAEQAAAEAYVVELDWRDGHGVLLRSSERRARRPRASARSARSWPRPARGRAGRAAAGFAGRSAGRARTRPAGSPSRAAPTPCRAGEPTTSARRRTAAGCTPTGTCR